MIIFGISFSLSDLYLFAIAGCLVMLLLRNYVPDARKRKLDTAAAYRLAFDDVLFNLRENPDCPIAQIAFGCYLQHLAAIDKFRSVVPKWKRRRFENDVAHYKEAYNIAREYGSVFAIALSEKTDVAIAKRKHYSEAIQRLLSYV